MSAKARREYGNIVKSRRIARYLKKVFTTERTVTPEKLYNAVYKRQPTKEKHPSLRDRFIERVLKSLRSCGYLSANLDVLKAPAAWEIFDTVWCKEVSDKTGVEERKRTSIKAVRRGDYWYQVDGGEGGGEVRTFFLLNSEESVEALGDLAATSPGTLYNAHFTDSYRATKRHVDYLLFMVPNLGIITCSEYTWLKRLRLSLTPLIKILCIPPGRIRTWTRDVHNRVCEMLKDHFSLGAVCTELNKFGIRISVQGLLRWRWREIKGPPPVFVW